MARVVGKDPSALLRRTCKGCTSIVEFTLNEVMEGSTSDYTGSTETTFSYITCPACRDWIKWDIRKV